MPKGHTRPSIRDVAALAGVSHQTVSRVLNAPDRVRGETLQRVTQAIEELGYRPSRAARSLATSDSMTIGVVSVHAALLGPSQMTFAIDEGARARGYATAAVTVRNDEASSLTSAREHLLGLGVDGVVVIAWSQGSLDLASQFGREIPTAVIAEGEVPAGVARARGDNVGGASQAVSALKASGRNRIAHLAGPADWLEARARRSGWLAAGQGALGQEVSARWDAESGYRGVGELLAKDPATDAIFAANDSVAAGALRRLGELGRRVPDDVAIVGYDDTELAPYLAVPLASVRQPFAEVGSAVIDLLFEVVAGGEAGDRLLASDFVWRESAGHLSERR